MSLRVRHWKSVMKADIGKERNQDDHFCYSLNLTSPVQPGLEDITMLALGRKDKIQKRRQRARK